VDGTAKVRLRAELIAARRLRTDDAIEHARVGIRRAVIERYSMQRWTCVAGYVPLRTEPGSIELLDHLARRGSRVLVPVVLPDRDLDWREWRPGGSPTESLGINAISAADAVLVPALAVAHDGTRLGRGGGSYDRALARVRDEVPAVALIYRDEFVTDLPRDSWDRPVSAVVTPNGWHDIGGR
jgi:5-formyltetrahydrofolate cyclo-ligase